MNDRAAVLLTICIFVVVLAGLGWFLFSTTTPGRSAHQSGAEPASNQQLSRLSEQISSLTEQIDQLNPGTGRSLRRSPEAPAEGEILIVWSDQPLPIDDPGSPAWSAAPTTPVALQRQDQAMPMLDEATMYEIRVQGLTNGRQIAWRLSWDDATADFHVDADLYCDSAALQFPLTPNAAYTMGDRGFQVQILQWKALWQKDIDEHFQDVQDLHPNYWADLYWFAEGEFPYPVPEAFQRPESLDYFVAYSAGNPVSDLHRSQPVQELSAEGFGTSTYQPYAASVGRGVWADGQWNLVISRPLETNDAMDYQFEPGARDVMAFAVWEGSVENVGGRKHHSQWIVFQVQQ